jgi:hypothetical protein
VSLISDAAGRRGISFTPQGEAMGKATLSSFRDIERAVASLRESRSGLSVTISAAPSIGLRSTTWRPVRSSGQSQVWAWRSGLPTGSCVPGMDESGPGRWLSLPGSSNKQNETTARSEGKRRFL